MGNLLADLRYALRTFKKDPGFTIIAALALALGIGANTAIFTVVNAVLLQPLPYPEPDRIVKVGRQFQGGQGYSNSIPKYMAWRRNNVFESMALYDQDGPGFNLGGDRPQQVRGVHASIDYFKVFGFTPAIGRTFSAIEDSPNGPKVTVLSYGLWKAKFGSDPQIIGRAITLNGEPYTVIGVMPSGFHPDVQSELWVPLQADPNSTNQGHYLYAAARLKPNVSLEQARAEMKVVGERFRKDNPKWMDKLESVAVVPLQEATVREVHSLLLILLGAVGFVLLIACANIANLLLARATGRQREVAIRAAIGADRWRIVRQLLTESILLAAVGAVLGFALGVAGVRTLLAMVPGNIPRLTQNGIAAAVPLLDWRVAAFTLGVAVVTGILFGLMPALQAANPELASTLKESSGRSGTGLKHNRARAVLVMTEVALAVVLLIGAALLIRTFISLRAVQPGFDAHNVLTFQTSLSGAAYDTTAKQAQFILQVSQRLEALPGIEAVTAAVALPTQTQIDLPFTIAGKEPSQGNAYNGDEQYRFISYGYLKALHIPLLRGRAFNRQDTGTSAPVVMINQEFAKRYWPKEDPVGRIITIGKGLGPEFEDPPRQIIGVVGNVKETGLSEKDTPVMYVPQTQLPQGLTRLASQVLPMKWAVRTVTDPIASRSLIEREIHAVDGQMPPAKVQPFQQLLGENMARQNFNMLLLSIFAGVALILAAIGIYGVISYSVEQRTQELGIRMALGAKHSEVLGLVVRQGMLLTGAGIVLGLGAAFALTRLLASFLFGVTAYDPVTFVFVPLTLALVAFSATYLPARRVLRIDPMEALRYE